MDQNNKAEIAYFGGGCFWCLEAAFRGVKGVQDVISGYAGGKTEDPSYEEVSSGETGHAEVVKIIFNPEEIPFSALLEVFFAIHDPTTLNQQGGDVGTQYRSLILAVDQEQEEKAEKMIISLNEGGIFPGPIVTEILKLDIFYPAEEYHQRYFEKNPEAAYCQAVIRPKLAKLRSKVAKYLK